MKLKTAIQDHIIERILVPKLLSEGLIKTYPIEDVIRILQRAGFNIDVELDLFKHSQKSLIGRRWKYLTINGKRIVSSITVNLSYDDVDRYPKLKSLMQALGYYPAFVQTALGNIATSKTESFLDNKDISKFVPIKIMYEAKYDLQLSPDQLPDKLYHAAPAAVYDKIKKIGLVPKAKWKRSKHPDRIYLATDIPSIEYLLNMFSSQNYVELEIDISQLKNQDRYKFYIDPNYGPGLYTMANIPPDHIKLIKLIKV